MKNFLLFLVAVGLFGALGVVTLNALDQPIAMVNGKGQCEYFVTIEDGHEVEGKCPQNWKKFQMKRVSSKRELEEMRMYFAGKEDLQGDEKEFLKSLKKELEKRARIAQRE